MRYKIFGGLPREWHVGDQVPRIEYKGEMVMAIDPSKTNCAVLIGDPEGEIYTIFEFTGNNWSSGPAQDTTEYCVELIAFLREYLRDVELVRVGLEKAITKRGMMHHHSNMVLTEIRANILAFLSTDFGFHTSDVEVNNWTWKRAILPEGFRSQSEKGSWRYVIEYLGKKEFLRYYEADVTDVYCIYQYLIQGNPYRIKCMGIEKPRVGTQVSIMPQYADMLNNREFIYNTGFKLEENVAYFINRSTRPGIAKVPVQSLSLKDIYNHSLGFSDIPKENTVRLCVYQDVSNS